MKNTKGRPQYKRPWQLAHLLGYGQHTWAMLTLHLTNGDSAASALARSGLPGDIVSWRDVLHDGPVPPDNDLRVFHRVRAEFLAGRGWSNLLAAITDFEERDARLDDVGAGDEVVLWFEPDLYDQLQLIQILARFERRAPSERPRLTIVPADCYLGPMLPEKFAPLYAARREITPEDLVHGRVTWRAFTSSTPARTAGWFAITPTLRPPSRQKPITTFAAYSGCTSRKPPSSATEVMSSLMS
jgi:hypothetical protein